MTGELVSRQTKEAYIKPYFKKCSCIKGLIISDKQTQYAF